MSELSSEIESILENSKDELVERLTAAVNEEVKKLIDVNEFVKSINVGDIVRRAVYDHFRQNVANEIGNRLRCGIYDGTSVDSLFESVWVPEFDKAIRERIRSRAYKAVDDVIAERLKGIPKL